MAKRLEKKLKPISFVLKSAEKIVNPVLEKRFAIRKAKLAQVPGPSPGALFCPPEYH